MTSGIVEWIRRARSAYSGEADSPVLDRILSDQLQDIREGSRFSMPISSALSGLILLVQIADGGFVLPIAWFVIVNAINAVRFIESIGPMDYDSTSNHDIAQMKRKLGRFKMLAAISGVAWAGLALLTDGFTIQQSSIYLVILAGICAGAVTYGVACAPVAINFITPPLVATTICLAMQPIWPQGLLVFAVILFLAGLVRGTMLGQRRFIEASKLKHEATRTAGEMETKSREDPLTGLLNRRGLEHAVHRFAPADGPFIVMLIDLDGFKSVNDTYGHKAGDDLLVAIAGRLRNVAPERAVLARIGGDEFVLLYPEISGTAEPDLAAARVIGNIMAHYQGILSVEIGACVGICRVEELDLVEMLLRADFALYSAKRRGRNGYCFFEKRLQQEWERKQSIERDLRLAIGTGQIQTYFQPVVEFHSRRIIGFEALLRWDHPQHGSIPPPDIINVACEVGVVRQLTKSISLNCFEMIDRLARDGYGDLTVAMNVSPRELSGGQVSQELLSHMEKRRLPLRMLEVEITEDAPFDQRDVNDGLGLLASAGVSIALDDFGTGFATFASLKKGIVRKIKVDQAFVRGISRSVRDQHLVRAIVELGLAMGIEVTAEGIESAEDCRTLLQLGCDRGQGFLFSPALPMEAAIAMLAAAVPMAGLSRGN